MIDHPDVRNCRTFWIGCLAAQGLSIEDLAQHLADGSSADNAATLEEMGYVPPVIPVGHEALTVSLSAKDLTRIAQPRDARARLPSAGEGCAG